MVQVALAQDGGSPFLGRSMAQQRAQMSGETKALIDQEVSRLVNQVHARTRARTLTHAHSPPHRSHRPPSLGPSLAWSLSRAFPGLCVPPRPLPASMAWLTLSRESASRPLGLCVLDRPQFAFKPPPFALVETPPSPPPLSSAHAPRVLWRLTHPARCQAYAKAKNLLLDNRPALDALAKLLIEKETVTADEFQQILNDTGVKIGSYGIYA